MKNFCFTANGKHQTWEEIEKAAISSGKITYICVGDEVAATTGMIHWQGFTQTAKGQRITAMQKVFGGVAKKDKKAKKKTPNWAWFWAVRMPNATNTEARDYCKKENWLDEKAGTTGPGFHEWGVFSAGVQGRRNDIHGTADIILEGGGITELIDGGCAEYLIKHRPGILGLIADILERKLPNRMPVETHFYWGEETGCGKTWAATTFDEDKHTFLIHAEDLGKGWWDGYTGQRTVVIDDWHPGLVKLSSMIKYMGDEKKRLAIKTSHTWAQYTTLIITSNTTYPEDIYTKIRQSRRETFFRRVDIVKHFNTPWVESTPTVVMSETDEPTEAERAEAWRMHEDERDREMFRQEDQGIPPLVRSNAFVFDTTTE